LVRETEGGRGLEEYSLEIAEVRLVGWKELMEPGSGLQIFWEKTCKNLSPLSFNKS